MATASKNVWPEQWDTTDALEQLIAQFNNSANYYTPRTAEDILAQAQGEYATYYDQQRLAANQAQQRTDLALQQQLAGLQTTYDKSREASQRQYNQAYSQADRGMIGRGMQRSSYGAQTLANISRQGAEAQQELWDQQAAAEGNINAQRAQTQQQLADQLRQFDASQAADVLNRQRELENEEYQRRLENEQYRAKLSDTIYNYLLDREKAAGGGSGGTNPQNPATNPTTTNVNPTSSWAAFMNALTGAAKTPAGTKTTLGADKGAKYQQKLTPTSRTNTTAPAATTTIPTSPTYDNWKANTAQQNLKNNNAKLLGRRTAM